MASTDQAASGRADRVVGGRHGDGAASFQHSDAFAIDELNPVVARFLPDRGTVLEVGCGYGRNLFAVGKLERARLVVGSDVDRAELVRAQERVAALAEDRIKKGHAKTLAEAQLQIFKADPALYRQYRKETSIAV